MKIDMLEDIYGMICEDRLCGTELCEWMEWEIMGRAQGRFCKDSVRIL